MLFRPEIQGNRVFLLFTDFEKEGGRLPNSRSYVRGTPEQPRTPPRDHRRDRLRGGGVLGHGLGALGHGVLGEVAGVDDVVGPTVRPSIICFNPKP